MTATRNPRASTVLTRAYETLQEQTAWIAEPEWRRAFLEQVPAHRALVAAAPG